MKPTRIIAAALFLCSLSSCKTIGPLFKVPGQLITAVGGGLGMNLTDEAPQPYDDSSPIEKPTTQDEPQEEPQEEPQAIQE